MASSDSQPIDVQLSNIRDFVDCGHPDQTPNMILSVSPCRSGTTVLLRVFSAAGVESHYQPLKNTLRWKLEASDVPWRVPRSPGQTIFVKETIGPYTQAESVFDPLSSLLDAGFPLRNLHLLIYARTPQQTWLSWRECWGPNASLKNLILAFHTTAQIERHARDLGIPVTTAVYEVLRDNQPALVVQGMFAHLGLRVSYDLIEKSVAALPPLADPNRHVIFPKEPAVFDSWPYLGRALSSQTLSYFRHDEQTLSSLDAQQLRASQLDRLYDRWRGQCEVDLGLIVRPNR